ncbi:MAG TPA: M23 family metallopeptidase [Candidatus Hydrogenedentes bacterium]|nr:M23 family metallopeptidase [Candidatus Hydrogenedentota bacterium]
MRRALEARVAVWAVVITAAAMGLAACATRPLVLPQSYPVPCIWPTPSAARVITSNYGAQRSAGGGASRFHKGIDISAPKGCPIYATADGFVARTDRDRRGYGKYVIVNHAGGYSTLYAHLSETRVKTGAWVRAGQVVGEAGQTGNATGAHLHYEVRRYGEAVDPRPFLP